MQPEASRLRTRLNDDRDSDWENYESFKKRAQGPMLLLSLLLVPIVVLPIAEDLSPIALRSVEILAAGIWGAFLIEYLVLLFLAPQKVLMIKKHKVDLVLLVLPFFRLARIVRLLRLVLYGSAGSTAANAVRKMAERPGFLKVLTASFVSIAVSGGLVSIAEHGQANSTIDGPADGVWWAIVTSSTVGYGDEFPVTATGRVIAVFLMLVGVAILSIVTANVAAAFVEESADQDNQLDRIEKELVAIRKFLEPRKADSLLDSSFSPDPTAEVHKDTEIVDLR